VAAAPADTVGAVSINQGPLWIMLAVACAIGVISTFRAQARRVDLPWRERWRTDRRSFLGGSIDALITGVGLGMVAVLVIVLLAAVFGRLGL